VAGTVLVLHYRRSGDNSQIADPAHLSKQLVMKAVSEVSILSAAARTREWQYSDRGDVSAKTRSVRAASMASQNEVVKEARRCRKNANAHEQQRQPNALKSGGSGGRGPLDPTRLHVKGPGEGDDDGKARSQCNDDVR